MLVLNIPHFRVEVLSIFLEILWEKLMFLSYFKETNLYYFFTIICVHAFVIRKPWGYSEGDFLMKIYIRT